MEREKTIFCTPRVSLKETPRGFQYLERKGKDSVAVFLIRHSQLNKDYFETFLVYKGAWNHENSILPGYGYAIDSVE